MGVRLLLFHPEFDRSCASCIKYLYTPDGELLRRPALVGLPVLRPQNTPTPCHECPKVPKGDLPSPESAVEMSEQNRTAYLHYLECRAVGVFPDDPIVRHNARLIRAVHDQHDMQPLRTLVTLFGSFRGESR